VGKLWRENWAVFLVVAAVITAFVLLRTEGSPVSSVGDVEAVLAGGQPALLEFYSNY
jgi:hypothetical protein